MQEIAMILCLRLEQFFNRSLKSSVKVYSIAPIQVTWEHLAESVNNQVYRIIIKLLSYDEP